MRIWDFMDKSHCPKCGHMISLHVMGNKEVKVCSFVTTVSNDGKFKTNCGCAIR